MQDVFDNHHIDKMDYDEGAKELLNLTDKGKVTLIKYLFKKDIDINKVSFTFGKNEQVNQKEDGSFDKAIKDIVIVVNEFSSNNELRYHIEVETKYKTSNNLLLRMFRYAINDDVVVENTDDKTYIELAEQAVLILTPTTDKIQKMLVIRENGKVILEKEYIIEDLASEPIDSFEDEKAVLAPLKIYNIIPKVQKLKRDAGSLDKMETVATEQIALYSDIIDKMKVALSKGYIDDEDFYYQNEIIQGVLNYCDNHYYDGYLNKNKKGEMSMLAEKYKQEYRAWKADVYKQADEQAEEKVQKAKIIMLQQSEEKVKKAKVTTIQKALDKGFDLDEAIDLADVSAEDLKRMQEEKLIDLSGYYNKINNNM